MRSCVTYINWFMVCPFFITLLLATTSSSLSYSTNSNHNLLYMYPPPTQMLIITPFFVMPYVPGTHYLTLLCHYLVLKGLYLITYNYCCAGTVLFLTLGCVLVRNNITLLLFMYPLCFGMNYYIQSSGFLLTFIGFEHTAWLVMHSSSKNRRGIGKLLATHDKYTVSYSTIKESQPPCVLIFTTSSPCTVNQLLLPSVSFHGFHPHCLC